MTSADGAKSSQPSEAPRAVIHKNILDAAREDPDASVEELANKITGGTVSVVKMVLEKYGDPAEQTAVPSDSTNTGQDTAEQTAVPSDSTPTEQDTVQDGELKDSMNKTNGYNANPSTEWIDLTDKQQETLLAIRDHPGATQADLSELLGVSSATINTRVNSIEGFDWERRHEFIDQVLDEDMNPDRVQEQSPAETDRSEPDQEKLVQRIQQLEERVQQLNEERSKGAHTTMSLSDDPELAHKILHACLDAESIDREEELSIVEKFIR